MILAESNHMNPDQTMVSNNLKRSRLTNGDAETNIQDQKNPILIQDFNGRQGNLGSGGSSASTCQDDDESEDISGSSINETACNKRLRQHNDMTIEDIYNKQDDFDDEDDDSDWEPQPLQMSMTLIKWFCVNCTMLNLDDVVHCHICGEHKRSGILKHGFLASPEEEMCLIQNGSEVTGISKGNLISETAPLGLYRSTFRIDVPHINSKIASCSQNLASKKSTAVGFDERMLLHFEVEQKSHPHPERPDRLRAIAASLATAGIFPGKCHPILAREITREELEKVHSVENIESVELTNHAIFSYFTPDTYANTHSACAARLAAGLCADLATSILSGRVKNGFALIRPPGHHAGVNQAMGFCLHNNAAIAASAALVAGAKKVLIVDWDVHHGNGTQEIFEKNKSVLYISLHRHEGGNFYPGTGAADQVGTMGAEGYCVNIPWSRGGVGDNDYLFAFQHVVLPIASKFAPDITIISAGFDAARGDPLGCCDVTPAGYAQMTQMLNFVSCEKLLVILEGGYNLRSISSSATAVVKVLLGESPCVVENIIPSRSGLRTVLEVLKIQMNFWPSLGPIFSELQSRWGFVTLLDKKKQLAKRRKSGVPLWWKLGRKRLLYHILCEKQRRKLKWW